MVQSEFDKYLLNEIEIDLYSSLSITDAKLLFKLKTSTEFDHDFFSSKYGEAFNYEIQKIELNEELSYNGYMNILIRHLQIYENEMENGK